MEETPAKLSYPLWHRCCCKSLSLAGRLSWAVGWESVVHRETLLCVGNVSEAWRIQNPLLDFLEWQLSWSKMSFPLLQKLVLGNPSFCLAAISEKEGRCESFSFTFMSFEIWLFSLYVLCVPCTYISSSAAYCVSDSFSQYFSMAFL